MTLEIILSIIIIHFVADFVCQTNEMALYKSKSNYHLTLHVVVYSGVLLSIYPLLLLDAPMTALMFVGVNGVLHWITDYFTSRLNARLWKEEKRHAFFIGIGFDQVIHYSCLFISYKLSEL